MGWPSAARFELGTLDGMIGCVAADMGVTLLPRAVVGKNVILRSESGDLAAVLDEEMPVRHRDVNAESVAGADGQEEVVEPQMNTDKHR